MDTTSTNRDDALRVVYRDLISTELAMGQAHAALVELGWTTAATDLADSLATVRDLIHDLQTYDQAQEVEA